MSERQVIEPRLAFWHVLRRGLCYGLGAVPVLVAVSLTVVDREDRVTTVAVFTGFAVVIGLICAVFGPFYWWCSKGDIRRWRDWRTCTGRYDSVGIFAATFVRLFGTTLVIAPGGLLYYALISGRWG